MVSTLNGILLKVKSMIFFRYTINKQLYVSTTNIYWNNRRNAVCKFVKNTFKHSCTLVDFTFPNLLYYL